MNSKKKVLILSLAYYPKFVGGAEVAIKEITDRIGDIEFHMITARFDSTLPKIEQIGNVLVHRIGIAKENPDIADLKKLPLHLNKFLFQFLAAIKAISLHKKNHYDFLWAMMAHSCGVPAALFKLRFPKVSFMLGLQEGDPPEYIERKMRLVWPLFKRAFTKATIVQAESTFLGKWARAMGFTGTVEVIPNAVTIADFTKTYSPEELESLRKKLGGSKSVRYIITTSRLVKKNAVDDCVRALKYLPDTVVFLVLGIGPDENKLKELAQKERVSKRVIFLGFIDNREVPKYLKISEVFIRPSLSEGMGNSFVEAMAAGTPIIGTNVGGIPDFLKDGETGLFCEVGNPKDIADKINLLLDNEELRKNIAHRAQKLALAEYDWDVIAKTARERVFDKVLL